MTIGQQGKSTHLLKNTKIFGKATKGVRWMPWHMETMKDVISCDKPRVGANNLRSGDFRMGQPISINLEILPPEYIGWIELTE